MVVAAEQRTREILPCPVQARDLLVEDLETAGSYGLPFIDIGGFHDALDVVESKTRILQHANEYQPTEGRHVIATLPGLPAVGDEQPASFVVTDGRGRDVRPLGDLTDGQQWLGHIPT